MILNPSSLMGTPTCTYRAAFVADLIRNAMLVSDGMVISRFWNTAGSGYCNCRLVCLGCVVGGSVCVCVCVCVCVRGRVHACVCLTVFGLWRRDKAN